MLDAARRRPARSAAALAAAVLGFTPELARAADVTSRWASASSGSWDANANWVNTPALGGFPNNGNGGVATYNAVIDATGAPYNVALNTNVTVDAFTLNSPNATFNHNASTLSAALGGINIQAGTYNLVTGTVANTTINQTGGALVVGNGRFSNVTMNGPLQLTAPSAALGVLSASTFNGAVMLGAAGTSARLGFFGTQTISPTTYNLEGSASWLSTEGAGTLTIPAGATVRGGNSGGIWYGFFSGGNANAIVNQGTIRADVAGTPFTINGSASGPFTSTGTLAAANGATLNINVPNWSSTGTLSVNNSTANLGGTFTSLGTITRSGGTINLAGTWDNTGKTVTLNATSGDVRLTNGIFKGGTINFSGGALVVPASNAGRIDGAHVNGSINLVNSSRLGLLNGATISGPVNVGDQAVVGLFTSQTAAATMYNLDGLGSYLSLEGSGAGTVTLPAGATVRGGNNGGIWYGFVADGNGATLDNRGAITADIPARTFTVFPSGSNKFFNSGTMSAVNGASLTVNAATWTNTAAGRISAVNSTLSFSGNWTNAGTVTVNNSTLNLGGTFTIATAGTINRTGGTVNVVGTWDNAGNAFAFTPTTGDWVLNGGTVRGGSLTFSGASLRISNNGANRLDGVTINGPLELNTHQARVAVLNASTFNGNVNLTAESTVLGFYGTQTLSPVTYAVTGTNSYLGTEGATGTLTIPAGATVRGGALGGAGIWYNFFSGLGHTNTVVNQGTIRADVTGAPFTVFPSGSNTFLNTGTLAATNGGRLVVNRMSGPINTVTASGAGSAVRFGSGTYTINQNLSVPAGTTMYFDGEWTKSATIDVGGFVVFDYEEGAPSPLGALRAQVVQGYNGGAWNGGGFNSTAAAATPGMALGYADTSVLLPSGGLFGGQQVDGNAFLVRMTRLGDANLDGTVNLADFNRLAAGFGTTSGAAWSQGDFDYNGVVNLADFNRLAANFGLSAAGATVTPEDWANLSSAIPEPAGVPAAALAVAAVLRRRRRR